ncbi:hypothetical protein D6D28_09252 [Aureobasidium pullulans]|uniref:Uncharacterized protein n=1 Tax=Aureobasidium pullulans TaxID=5580 RepID=A0A4S8S528_AURPU|nr:hypothetical protein D6D28_09252 [Aureobasidium pullulans]
MLSGLESRPLRAGQAVHPWLPNKRASSISLDECTNLERIVRLYSLVTRDVGRERRALMTECCAWAGSSSSMSVVPTRSEICLEGNHGDRVGKLWSGCWAVGNDHRSGFGCGSCGILSRESFRSTTIQNRYQSRNESIPSEPSFTLPRLKEPKYFDQGFDDHTTVADAEQRSGKPAVRVVDLSQRKIASGRADSALADRTRQAS